MKNIGFDSKIGIAIILVLHLIVGLITVKFRFVPAFLGISVFLFGVYYIYKNKNRNGEAHLFALYMMGAELFIRMTASGLPWDFARYAIIIMLILGLYIEEEKSEKPWMILLYFLLMLPGIYLTGEYYYEINPHHEIDFDRIRKAITFNLFGSLLLTVSTFYFYKRKFSLKEFEILSRWIIYPICMTSIYIYFNIGDYSAVQFTYSSNAESSGGFSGNQVSMVFGLGILIIGLNFLLGNKIFYSSFIDVGLIMVFTFQGLMTFSRGGLLSGILALAFGAFVYYLSSFERFLLFLKFHLIKLVLVALLGTGAFIYTDEMTGGFLYARYFNVKEDGYKVKDDISTGRGDIGKGDLELFTSRDYVGVGPGVSAKERSVMRGFAAHVEYTRILAEHGLLGLISLCILFLLPFFHFLRFFHEGETTFIFLTLITLSFLSMGHSAMRLAMIAVLYGMAYMSIFSFKKTRED